MYRFIEVDGNDGTGKTTFIEKLKYCLGSSAKKIIIRDRGLFSNATLNDDIFNGNGKTTQQAVNFYDIVKENDNTLYIILDASIEICQRRILKRGDSLEEKYHTKEDLEKYRNRFNYLVHLCNDLQNVLVIDKDEDD